jgi:ribosomal protein S18
MIKRFKDRVHSPRTSKINSLIPKDELQLDIANIANNIRKVNPSIKTDRKIFSHLNFKSIYLILGFFLDSQKQILPRDETGLSSSSQRILKRTIKNARKLGILPSYKPLKYDKLV